MKRLRDLNVAPKLFAGFGIVCLLLAAMVSLGINRLASSQANLTTMSSNGVASVQTIGDVKAAFLASRLDISSAVMVPDAAWAAYLLSVPAAPAVERGKVETLIGQYRTAREAQIPLARAQDVAGFIASRDATTGPIARLLTDELDTIVDLEQNDAKTFAAEGKSDYHTAVIMMLVLGSLAVIIAALIAVAVSRSIAGPLTRVLGVVQGLATGRLDQRVGYRAEDEVGRLAAAVDNTMDKLTATIAAIAASAASMAASSEELTTVATQLSAGAEETSAQSQVVSTATEEISTNIGTVAAAGEEMTSAIREIATSTAQASATAADAVAAASSAGVTIDRLGSSSREIGDVVKLITSIAEQTNLLALNATIEAARAGEMGKGFAVVAGEVKELAHETAQATEEISRRVATIQAETTGAVRAINEIADVIERINDFQATIAAAVEEQAATTSEMNRNVAHAAEGSGDIANGVADVAGLLQGTSGTAAESQGIAGELDVLSQELQTLVSRFHV